MTSLEKAFTEARRLPPEEQDEFAAWLLHELASEHRWHQAFAGSADLLSGLADEALADHFAGHTEPMDPGRAIPRPKR